MNGKRVKRYRKGKEEKNKRLKIDIKGNPLKSQRWTRKETEKNSLGGKEEEKEIRATKEEK